MSDRTITNQRAMCVVLRGDPPSEVLLGYKKVRFGANKYQGFGGKLEPGETVRQAAMRELWEESGLRVLEVDLINAGMVEFEFPAAPDWDQQVHVFRVLRWSGDPIETAEMRPEWFPVDQVPYARMWPDAVHWYGQIIAGTLINLRIIMADDNEHPQQIIPL